MNRLIVVFSLSLSILMGITGSGYAGEKIKAGIFSQDKGNVAVKEIARALEDKGIKVDTFKSKDVSEGKIYNYDVLFFGGGWSCYNWLDLQGRMHLVEFVQKRGGGVIFSMFRCGSAARSLIRPIFPEVAYAYNKSNGPGIMVVDKKHPVMRGIPEKFMTSFWDHAVMRIGPEGEVLAVDTNNDISIACGEVGKGRVVFIGPWIGIDKDGNPSYPLPSNDEILLLNSINWVTANRPSPQPSPTRGEGYKVEGISEEIKLKVLRREKILDWTHDERGISWYAGIMAIAMYPLEERLDDLLFRTKQLVGFAEETTLMKELLRIQERLFELKNQLQHNYQQAKKEKIAEINLMSVGELEREPVRDLSIRGNVSAQKLNQQRAEEWKNQLLFSYQIEPVEKEVARLEKLLAGNIEKVEEKEIVAERKKDARLIPQLIEQLQSKNSELREKAALELGRIGEKRAVKSLIEILKDTRYPVRRNAIYALGWMQAKESVPELLKLAKETKDVWTKRRVVEALGLIGDTNVTEYLIETLDNPDRFVRQNAILSLGWLGDKRAVPSLLKILQAPLTEVAKVKDIRNIGPGIPIYQQDHQNVWSREEMLCTLRALGHIGERKAIPAIKEFIAQHKEEKLGGYFSALYFSALRVEEAGSLALEEIEAGGRKERGVKQPEFLKGREDFYWLTGQYNAFYGRYLHYPSYPKEPEVAAGYIASSGGTGLIESDTTDEIEEWYPKADQYLAYLSQLGLKINPGWRRRGTAIFDKGGFERDILSWGKYPALGGFWAEEALWWEAAFRNDENFRRYLAQKYTLKQLLNFGIKDIAKLRCPEPTDEGRKEKFLFAEYMEYLAERGVETWQEAAEWLTALRKGTYLTFSLSQRYIGGKSTYISAYPRISQIIGANGPQDYGEHSYGNNFHLDMICDGEVRPALGEFYAHQADTPARVERGFASSFLHGQNFFVWWWGHIFKHAPDGNGGCNVFDKGRWEAAERQFRKGKAISDYLVPAESPKLICQIYSGRTSTLSYGTGSPDGLKGGRIFRYTQNQQSLWEALIQSHLPVDMIWLETITSQKLGRYKVAILSDGRSLKKEEIDCIKNWVKEGGILIATGGTTLHDQWDRPLTNYALSDVFGVNYVESEMTGPLKETLLYVERDLKPINGIGKVLIKDSNYLKYMEGKESAEYEKNIGYDVAKITTSKVIGVWADGTPAVVENRYDKGWSIFLSPVYPGLSHTTGGWTVDNLYKDFWDGSRELIAGCVRRALELTNAELPIEIKHCPKRLEVALKKQNDENRWIVHLLNMDPKISLMEGVEVSLNIPTGKKPKEIYYPYPGKEKVAYTVKGNVIRFKVRNFDVHEMVVVRY
ncbi:MAG: hypothetical protein COS11_02265 [bacterium (Candidatus Ratteibacteria) CG01_land_8_20_14_3_00_40_19]|uniref:Beta-galactosidase trimerisation domain-containing protein n=1 Tax=bacterium (Candidatus Ratteibacteria) CG01_land_8_20_14_3_00_40_19 TaxID=2014290 RepID=A0A2M7E9P9_9BACT|nr:MAG: hypothetical protein COS11_02265 [bacterium (Candidatus Ratteibacteria) CG01_land_8_20_14_3_00_40_19]